MGRPGLRMSSPCRPCMMFWHTQGHASWIASLWWLWFSVQWPALGFEVAVESVRQAGDIGAAVVWRGAGCQQPGAMARQGLHGTQGLPGRGHVRGGICLMARPSGFGCSTHPPMWHRCMTSAHPPKPLHLASADLGDALPVQELGARVARLDMSPPVCMAVDGTGPASATAQRWC